MRLSTLGEKEMVNLSDGGRLGLLSSAELLIDEKFGKIKAILIPDHRYGKGFFSGKNIIQVPWKTIKKVGADIIIFESTHEDYMDE